MAGSKVYLSAAVLCAAVAVNASAQQGKRIELSSCSVPGVDKARCGVYSVYENRESKSGRKIDLKIVVLPAKGPDRVPDPIFLIAGGPGQGAASIAATAAAITDPFRSRRDVVLIDQRGTGDSNGLQCDPAPGVSLFESYSRLMFDPAALRACRERLSQRADLTQYTTIQAVDDLDEVRAALGYEKINLMGGSYGSRVVLVYLRRHPASVRSAMAWSIMPANAGGPLIFAQNAQRALEAVLADCEEDAGCRSAFPKLREQFQQVMARVESRPVTVTVKDPEGKDAKVTVDRGWVAETVRYLFYAENPTRRFPLLIDRAARGDFAPLVQFGIERRAGLQQELAMGMLMSVVCAEDIPLIRPAEVKRTSAGTFLRDYRVRQQVEACRDWPRARLPEGFAEDVRSDLPVLLVSGEFDPATAPAQGESVRRHLSRSAHVIVPEAGHGWWGLVGAGCVDQIVGEFLDTADPGKLDTSCLQGVRRGPFVTDRNKN